MDCFRSFPEIEKGLRLRNVPSELGCSRFIKSLPLFNFLPKAAELDVW
jgi:hypothetical protein